MRLASYRCPETRGDGTKRDVVLSGRPIGVTGVDGAAIVVVDPDDEVEPYRVLLVDVPRLGEVDVPGSKDGWTVLGVVSITEVVHDGGYAWRQAAVVARPAFERRADGRADVEVTPPAVQALMGSGITDLLNALFAERSELRLDHSVLFADAYTIADRLEQLGWVRAT